MSGPDEKKQLTDAGTTEDVSPPPDSSCSAASDAPIDPEAERKLVWKLDLILFPVFFVIYMMAFLDRINISNASIQGLTAELHLDEGNRFNVALFVSRAITPPFSPLNTLRMTSLANHLRVARHITRRTFSSRYPPT